MEIFSLTLQQTLMMFVFMLTGFLLRKLHILPENTDITLSRLETYFFVPALNLLNWMQNCTVSTLKANMRMVLGGFLLIMAAVTVGSLLSRAFVPHATGNSMLEYRRNIYKYGLTFGNFGFMGNFLVLSVWGDEVFFYYSVFCFFPLMASYTLSALYLIPKDQIAIPRWKLIGKAFLTPPVFAIFLGMLLGLCNITSVVPAFLTRALSGAGNCMGPVAMVLAGFVIGGYPFCKLLTNRTVYLLTALRLLVIPSAAVLIFKLCGADTSMQTFALIFTATPLGLNTIVYPAAFGGETQTGASMAMISHTLSVVTIPLMYLLWIVLL